MYKIETIANWFINKEAMDHKKVQKLCYYTQAWHYALYENKLIDAEFEAWIHGPVNRKLWEKLKKYGYDNVKTNTFKNVEVLDVTTINFLERIWVTYGEFTGDQLEAVSLQETPWQNARQGYAPYEICKEKISVKDMISYYTVRYIGE